MQTLICWSPEQILKFLAHSRCIPNQTRCSGCGLEMVLVGAADCPDGFKWRCSSCGGEKGVREGSFFASPLPISKLIYIVYVWSVDYWDPDTKHSFLELEARIPRPTTSEWMHRCQEVCLKFHASDGVFRRSCKKEKRSAFEAFLEMVSLQQ